MDWACPEDIPWVKTLQQHLADQSCEAILDMVSGAWAEHQAIQVEGINHLVYCMVNCCASSHAVAAQVLMLCREEHVDLDAFNKCEAMLYYSHIESVMLLSLLHDMVSRKAMYKSYLVELVHRLSNHDVLGLDLWALLPWQEESWPAARSEYGHG